MKKLLTILLALAMLALCACNDEEEEVKITDALKISAWVMADGLWGTGQFTYDAEDYQYCGEWVSEDGTVTAAADVFACERLELGVPRVMAPMGYDYRDHVQLFLDYDGIVEVEVSEKGNEYVRLLHSLDYPMEPWKGGRITGNAFRAIAPTAVEVNPVGKFVPDALGHRDTLTGCEYYINIRALDTDGSQLISAEIRLTVLEDAAFPYWDVYFPVYGENEVRSRFLEVELVAYEYSDVYKLDEMEER